MDQQGKFNPFTDRLSRDIRNRLSEKLVEAMEKKSPEPFETEAAMYKKRFARNSEHGYLLDYITDRSRRYRSVVNQLLEGKITDPKHQAMLLWNERLFFEFHEFLELLWHESTGEMKRTFQGLIKAAGAHIHLEQKRFAPAASLGKKAAAILARHKSSLSFLENPDILIKCLDPLNPEPPKVVIKKSNPDFRVLP